MCDFDGEESTSRDVSGFVKWLIKDREGERMELKEECILKELLLTANDSVSDTETDVVSILKANCGRTIIRQCNVIPYSNTGKRVYMH